MPRIRFRAVAGIEVRRGRPASKSQAEAKDLKAPASLKL